MPGTTSASSSDPLRLTFARTGGFGGDRLALELDERELAPEEAAALAEAVASGAFEAAAPAAGPGLGADTYQYDLALHRGDDVRAVRVDEFALPPELARLVELLERRALEAARKRRRG